jgi:predicted dehydrogenase
LAIFTAVVVGCGAMSKGWLRAIAENPDLAHRVSVAGLVDLDPARAQALADEFGLRARIGSDLDAMLAALNPDLVFDVVVPAARSGVVTAALRHGAHVLSEKPMAASMDEASALVALARESGRVHAVVQNRRFIPGVRRMRRMVADGTLGAITAVHCDFFIGAHFGGFREEMQHALLLDMAIHTFDATRCVIGHAPRAVYCQESNPEGSWYAHGASANAIFEFDGDTVATYRGSWCAEGANTSWESRWRVIGTRGTLLWDGADGFEARLVTGTDGFLRDTAAVAVPEAANPAETQGHASVIRDFIASIEQGTEPETAGADNLASLAMVFGAIESARTGRRVDIH